MKKETFLATIDSYNSKNIFFRVKRKLSYFHKQLFIQYLIWTKTVKKFNTQIISGDKMEIVLPDNISQSLYLVGFFEGEETKAFLSLMEPGKTFIDVGAHIGYYSILANAIGGEKSKIISIEPTPSTFEILKENMRGKGNITLLNIGLYSENGIMQLNDFGIHHMCLNSFQDARSETKINGNKISVPVNTLDTIINELKISPDIIKIDAESAELEILKGAGMAFEKKAVFFVEVGDFNQVIENSSLKIIEFFENKGYNAFEFEENEFKLHQKSHEKYKSMSLYFFPN